VKTFSAKAHEWLRNYHGSIDSTALLLAYDAGRRSGQRAERKSREHLPVDQGGTTGYAGSGTVAAETSAALRRKAERELQPYLGRLDTAHAVASTARHAVAFHGNRQEALDMETVRLREALTKALELLGVAR
jgi:hypothetical protein